jgi:small subunit ribosomal protein S21
MVEIFLKQGESVETALRRLKDKTEKEGTMDEVRRLRAFETPAQKKKRKAQILAKKMAQARRQRGR